MILNRKTLFPLAVFTLLVIPFSSAYAQSSSQNTALTDAQIFNFPTVAVLSSSVPEFDFFSPVTGASIQIFPSGIFSSGDEAVHFTGVSSASENTTDSEEEYWPEKQKGFFNNLKYQLKYTYEHATENVNYFGDNFRWFWNGFKLRGLGEGCQDEWMVMPHFGVKGELSDMIYYTDYENYWANNFRAGAVFCFYPLSKHFHGPYAAGGGYADFFSYFTMNEHFSGLSYETSETVLSLWAQLGCKVILPLYYVLDVYIGYKYPVYCSNGENPLLYGSSGKILNGNLGLNFGFKFYETNSFWKMLKAIF